MIKLFKKILLFFTSVLIISASASKDANASLTFGGFLLALSQNVLQVSYFLENDAIEIKNFIERYERGITQENSINNPNSASSQDDSQND